MDDFTEDEKAALLVAAVESLKFENEMYRDALEKIIDFTEDNKDTESEYCNYIANHVIREFDGMSTKLTEYTPTEETRELLRTGGWLD